MPEPRSCARGNQRRFTVSDRETQGTASQPSAIGIALVDLVDNNYRPVNPERVAELAQKMALEGFRPELGTPGVRAGGDGRYQIVFGHHRVAAARRLDWESIPCTVLERSDTEALLDQVG